MGLNYEYVHSLIGDTPEGNFFLARVDGFVTEFAEKFVAFTLAYHRTPEYAVRYVKELLESKFANYKDLQGFETASLFGGDS